MIKELETVTVDAVNASNMIEHFMWVFFLIAVQYSFIDTCLAIYIA